MARCQPTLLCKCARSCACLAAREGTPPDVLHTTSSDGSRPNLLVGCHRDRYVYVQRTILVRLVDAVKGVQRLVNDAVAKFLDKWQRHEWAKYLQGRPESIVTTERAEVHGAVLRFLPGGPCPFPRQTNGRR